MGIVSQALDAAGEARPDREMQMDQRKPAAPAPASEMSREGAAGSGQGAGEEAAPAALPAPAVEQLISRQLRAIYDEVVNEPVPERFVRLLEELERKRGGS